MGHRLGSLLACAVAGLIFTFAAPARALTCEEFGLRAPFPGATGVPTNTLVWCSRRDDVESAPVQLTAADGTRVSGTQTELAAPEYRAMVFHPQTELAPNTEYHVACVAFRPNVERTYRFTTGAGPRRALPRVPDLTDLRFQTDPGVGWGPSYFAVFGQVSEPGSIVVLDLNREARLDAADPSGSVTDAELLREGVDELWVGDGPCGGSWRGADLGASTSLRLGAFDVTGTFSGWSESVTVTLPDEFTTSEASPETGGCQLGGGAGTWSAAVWLVVLACAAVRRIRRS